MVEKITYTLLAADATLLGLLGVSSSTSGLKKIYPTIAPQREKAPFITYSQVSEGPEHCAQGLAVRAAYVQVDCWAADPLSAATLAERVVTVLSQHAGTVAGHNVDNILFENQSSTFEPDLDEPLYGKQVEFQIRVVQ